MNSNEHKIFMDVAAGDLPAGLMPWLEHRAASLPLAVAIEHWKTLQSYRDDDKADARIMRLLSQITDCKFRSDGGQWVMYVYQWGRDCDQCESDSMFKIPATLEAFERAVDEMYDGAEGPCSMSICTALDYAEFQPTFRDRRAEQYGY